MEQNNQNEPIEKKKLTVEDKIKEFFIPRNFFDVVFIAIAFFLAWYAITYDIANAKVPVICANYWNKWAAEKAAYLGRLNASQEVATYVLNLSINTSNFTLFDNIH